MKDFTTIEKLQMKVSATYGSVLKFGDYVLATDAHYKGGFTADIYEFVETPEETGLGDVECQTGCGTPLHRMKCCNHPGLRQAI